MLTEGNLCYSKPDCGCGDCGFRKEFKLGIEQLRQGAMNEARMLDFLKLLGNGNVPPEMKLYVAEVRLEIVSVLFEKHLERYGNGNGNGNGAKGKPSDIILEMLGNLEAGELKIDPPDLIKYIKSALLLSLHYYVLSEGETVKKELKETKVRLGATE